MAYSRKRLVAFRPSKGLLVYAVPTKPGGILLWLLLKIPLLIYLHAAAAIQCKKPVSMLAFPISASPIEHPAVSFLQKAPCSLARPALAVLLQACAGKQLCAFANVAFPALLFSAPLYKSSFLLQRGKAAVYFRCQPVGAALMPTV